jgi:hypothetical protein
MSSQDGEAARNILKGNERNRGSPRRRQFGGIASLSPYLIGQTPAPYSKSRLNHPWMACPERNRTPVNPNATNRVDRDARNKVSSISLIATSAILIP